MPLQAYLVVACALFSIGLWGAVSQRGLVMIIMAVELMLNAANVAILAFWRFLTPNNVDPHIFAIIVLTVAAVEEAMGLGIALLAFRHKTTQNVDRFTEMSG